MTVKIGKRWTLFVQSLHSKFVTPPLSEIAKKTRENVEIHPPLSKYFRHRWLYYPISYSYSYHLLLTWNSVRKKVQKFEQPLLFSIQCTIQYTIYYTVYNVLYSIQCTIQYTVCYVQCTYVQHTVYNVHMLYDKML